MIHVSKAYEDNPNALFDISLRVEKGQFLYLVGSNGAGKTTLLKLLYAAERPTAGEIRVNGVEVGRLAPRKIPYLRRTLGLVFQDLKLLPRRTAYENVAFALEAVGAERGEVAKKATQALRGVGLERRANCLPSQLSAGEQQRLAIARAVGNDPVVLLADQPAGHHRGSGHPQRRFTRHVAQRKNRPGPRKIDGRRALPALGLRVKGLARREPALSGGG
jgi:cell division transport system ATP-binding protein